MTYQVIEEFQRLKEIITELKPRTVLEIGSLTGETLWHWIQLAQESVISLDMVVPEGDWRRPEQMHGHTHLWPEWAKAKGIGFFCVDGDSTNQAIVDQIWGLAGGRGSLDFLFIDGGHDLRTAALDYFNYAPLVRKGGVIAFHDRSNPDWPEVAKVWEAVKRNYERTEEIGGRMGIGVLWV